MMMMMMMMMMNFLVVWLTDESWLALFPALFPYFQPIVRDTGHCKFSLRR